MMEQMNDSWQMAQEHDYGSHQFLAQFKMDSLIQVLTMGRALQFGSLLQVLSFQAEGPWPSNFPPPLSINWSMYWNVIQWFTLIVDASSVKAFKVPMIWNSTGPLHGPFNTIGRNIYIPRGINTSFLPLDWQALLNTFSKTYKYKHTQ